MKCYKYGLVLQNAFRSMNDIIKSITNFKHNVLFLTKEIIFNKPISGLFYIGFQISEGMNLNIEHSLCL